MKNYKKVGIALMVVGALALGLVLAGCEQVFEGYADAAESSSVGAKFLRVTLTGTTYKVEYDDKTAKGNCTVFFTEYTGTSEDFFAARVEGSTLTFLYFVKKDKSWTVFTYELNKKKKKSVAGAEGAVSLDDVEFIIEE